MSKKISTWVVLVVMAIMAAGCWYGITITKQATTEHLYPRVGQVTEINRSWGYVAIKDSVGELWLLYDVDDWAVGDVVSMMLNDNNTDTITDDIIVKAYYSGRVK